jgi:branched-chain amino acid transport system permease protein
MAVSRIGSLTVGAQTLWVLGSSLTLIVVLAFFFERTIYGKALRATAMNRTGASVDGDLDGHGGQAFISSLPA